MNILEKKRYTVQEVAEKFGVSEATIKRAYRNGLLPYRKPHSRLIYFLDEDLEYYEQKILIHEPPRRI